MSMYVLHECLVHLLVASVSVFKGLPSSLHTIAARERAVVALTFTDTRTLTPYTRSRYLAVYVPNVMLFVLPMAATIHYM